VIVTASKDKSGDIRTSLLTSSFGRLFQKGH